MINFLAETAAAQPDTMVSGNWIIGMIGAICTGIALILGKKAGLKEATNNVTIQPPFPEVPFRKVSNPVSFDQHAALDARVTRMELHFDQMQRDQSLQYKQILESGAAREQRLAEVMNDGLRAVHDRLDQFLNKPTPPRR